MNTFVIVFFVALYGANAAPWATTNIIKGPETSATVVGPDGSKISAQADAGAIKLNSHKIVPVLAPAPVLVSHDLPLITKTHETVVVQDAPTIIKSTPIITSTKLISHGSTVIQHDLPVLTTKTIVSPIVSVPVVHKTVVTPVVTKTSGTIIAGPSGIIQTSGPGLGLVGVQSSIPC